MLQTQDAVQEPVWLFVEVDDVRWEGATAITCLRIRLGAAGTAMHAQRTINGWMHLVFLVFNLHELESETYFGMSRLGTSTIVFHYAAIRGGCSAYLPYVSYVAAQRSGQRRLRYFVYNMLNRAYRHPCPREEIWVTNHNLISLTATWAA
jgi:hypothetical protein